MRILYEDNHVLAVFKPAGLLTQPSPDLDDSLENRLKALIKERDEKKGGVFLDAVHRLDKETSGIVVFSKSSKATPRLKKSLSEGKWEKTYLAKTIKAPANKEGELEHFHIKEAFKARISSRPVEGGKKALLGYKIIEKKGLYLWEIKLVTGRYHQIRAQLSYIGCPILGDMKYGGEPWEGHGIALEHTRVVFPHPISGDDLEIRSSHCG